MIPTYHLQRALGNPSRPLNHFATTTHDPHLPFAESPWHSIANQFASAWQTSTHFHPVLYSAANSKPPILEMYQTYTFSRGVSCCMERLLHMHMHRRCGPRRVSCDAVYVPIRASHHVHAGNIPLCSNQGNPSRPQEKKPSLDLRDLGADETVGERQIAVEVQHLPIHAILARLPQGHGRELVLRRCGHRVMAHALHRKRHFHNDVACLRDRVLEDLAGPFKGTLRALAKADVVVVADKAPGERPARLTCRDILPVEDCEKDQTGHRRKSSIRYPPFLLVATRP